MSPQLYWRKFTRDGTADQNTLADDKFLAENFTDFFGKWLRDEENSKVVTCHDLVMKFWDVQNEDGDPAYEVNTFAVADAGWFSRKKHPDWKWLKPFIRFLTVVKPSDSDYFDAGPDEWSLAIVGGSRPRDKYSFLQVASWDGRAFRFYQRDTFEEDTPAEHQAWNYFGHSQDAFGDSSYLGPFNGHVNGACIMKELHAPWIHWLGVETGSFKDALSADDIKEFQDLRWITQEGGDVLSAINTSPRVLEEAIKQGVNHWFDTRKSLDYLSSGKVKTNPSNIPRWVAHLFLTTTINIGCALSDGPTGKYILPANHIYDSELLSAVSTNLMPKLSPILFDESDYKKAVKNLQLCILMPARDEDVADVVLPWHALGGDKREDPELKDLRFMKLQENSEGLSPFNILHPSYEDAIGVQEMQSIKKLPNPDHTVPASFIGLFSAQTFNAIMMVDFWNPIYSWKRGILMQYVPLETTFDGKEYDLDARFVEKVRNSPNAKLEDTPEYEFLQLLETKLETHQKTIVAYFDAIQARIKSEPVAALEDYLTLAESRRRIYRPLPLDEFGPTMPFSLKYPDVNVPMYLEMKPDATIREIPSRGQTFLTKWTSTLSGLDPQILPSAESEPTQAPVAIDALPRPSRLAAPCQATASQGGPGPPLATKGCPFMSAKSTAKTTSGRTSTKLELVTLSPKRSPTWTDDILPLIQTPHWVSGDPAATGKLWIEKMAEWGQWNLASYEDVKEKAVGIYRHLRAKSMPITRDPQNYWPEDALETFRTWVNAGFPRDSSHFPSPDILIPKPIDAPESFKIRRDIMSLSREELAVYQSKLDDILQVDALGSKWQELGLLHAYWCLHYQEATFLWHRAYLLYVEKLIGFPIPYWNGYTAEAADPKSEFAGIPPMFLEDKYIHPADGSERPNPLKYSLSLNGRSKSGGSEFVTRSTTLTEGPSSPDWGRKIELFKLYHEQIEQALKQSTYTTSETAEHFGVPWANITTFSEDQQDCLYPYRFDFDGLFEQVHDNFHGWVGPDMADNTYTAFDPIFLSYHANMDRLAGIFIDAHPESQFTSGFPLQPFINNGTDVSYDDPRRWRYTTIGDMAKDTRSLGYMYAAPERPDVFTPVSAAERGIASPRASGGRAISLPAGIPSQAEAKHSNGVIKATTTGAVEKEPFVVFTGVGCTTSSYRIDVFTAGAQSLVPDVTTNSDFIGQVTRIGMGRGRQGDGPPNSGRCRKPAATRVLPAGKVKEQLLKDTSVKIVVTNVETGQDMAEGDYAKMPGFTPKVVWLAR
ncbi:Tyrosinase-Cu-bd domain-containing protein [Fusarium keratoplasticum]|uniref:Tyrosinase-Cu-bd domain-containing protein n=1 Tax=Fusarium keratoplasticum TaxID=1328300 RepID=A0ACC0QQL9_9HYPO|nr:Tyrosinase-Cu-bd domain-containing protein [Fusarium keratoplasticum]KAI8660255.1 Tyrosinase-Cu-bd domain-containing protein [Fusarium keratoplasticum]